MLGETIKELIAHFPLELTFASCWLPGHLQMYGQRGSSPSINRDSFPLEIGCIRTTVTLKCPFFIHLPYLAQIVLLIEAYQVVAIKLRILKGHLCPYGS